MCVCVCVCVCVCELNFSYNVFILRNVRSQFCLQPEVRMWCAKQRLGVWQLLSAYHADAQFPFSL